MKIQVRDMLSGTFSNTPDVSVDAGGRTDDYPDIEKALALLIQGDLSVEEIAQQVPTLERPFLNDLAEAIRQAYARP